MVKPWSWLRSLTSALIVMTPSMGIWGNSLALAQELPPTNLDTYIGNWELFVIEEDVGLQYQGGVLMEQSHQRLMGLVFLELEDGLVGMLELEPQGPEEFIGRMWMFDLQLKPVEQQSITIPITAIASQEEQPYLELTLEADGVLLQEDVRMLASLLTPAVEAQRQAQSNLYYVNLSQEVYFGQFGQFNQEIESLFYLLGEDQFYRYSLNKLEGQQAIIQTIAKPQQYDLRTYIGAVMALEDGEFAAIRCEAKAPGVMAAVPMAEFVEGEVLCPAGFREIL